MSLVILFALATFLGLAAILTALALGWYESRNPEERARNRALGTVCLLVAGVVLLFLVQWKVGEIYAYLPMVGLEYFTQGDGGRVGLHTAALLVLTMVALGYRLMNLGPNPGKRSLVGKCLTLALIATLIEINVVQYLRNSWDDNYVPDVPRPALLALRTGTPEGHKRGYRFRPGTESYFGDKRVVWSTVLASYKDKPEVRYLEVGLFEGQSAFWMIDHILTNPTSHLTGIDPFFDSDGYAPSGEKYKDVFYANLKTSGAEERATIIQGFSQIEMRKLPLKSFDIIYIDGSHVKGDVLEDAILAFRLLKDDGVLIFDDYFSGTKAAVDIFYSCFRDNFDVIHVAEQVILKKHPPKP